MIDTDNNHTVQRIQYTVCVLDRNSLPLGFSIALS